MTTEPSSDHEIHERCVDTWLAGHAAGATATTTATATDRIAALLLVGLRALWDRARPALGEVTLGAIFRRAIETAGRRHSALCALGLHVVDRGSVEMSSHGTPRADLNAGARFLLVELLRVIARLSAGALTPALHTALSDARLNESAWFDPPQAKDRRERVQT